MMHLTAFKYVYFNKLFNCYLYMVLVLHSTTTQYKQKGIQQMYRFTKTLGKCQQSRLSFRI